MTRKSYFKALIENMNRLQTINDETREALTFVAETAKGYKKNEQIQRDFPYSIKIGMRGLACEFSDCFSVSLTHDLHHFTTTKANLEAVAKAIFENEFVNGIHAKECNGFKEARESENLSEIEGFVFGTWFNGYKPFYLNR